MVGNKVFYIFGYTEQNRKARITGFVKTQFQSAVLLVQSGLELSICIKGLYTKEPADFQVYVYACEGKKVLAVQVGTITVVGGHGTGTITLPVENIAESGFALEEICGLIVAQRTVKQQDVEFETMISKWEDTDGDFTQIEYHAVKNNNFRADADSRAAAEAKTELPDKVVEAAEVLSQEVYVQSQNQNIPMQREEAEPADTSADESADTPAVKSADTLTDTPADTSAVKSADTLTDESESVTIPESESAASAVQAAAVKQLEKESNMDLYFKNHRHIDAFEDDDYYHCIEVTPEQLQNMLGDQMNVQANSFIMHGFYMFRHILVARVCNEPGAIMIGVPGVYSNKERFMASMFGFSSFKRSHRADCRNQCFGYWYSSAMYT